MNMKKIVCFSLALGCMLSLTSCSNVKDISSNTAIENNKTDKQNEEITKINKEIAESIIKQIKNQINDEKKSDYRIVLINDTEYVITQPYIDFNIKDNDGINSTASLMMLDVDVLEPGQKCYAEFYLNTSCNGVKEIRAMDSLFDEEMYNKKNTSVEVDMINMEIVTGSEDYPDIQVINGIVKNNSDKDYSDVEFRLRYIDDEGFINDIGGGFFINEFISGESYYIGFEDYYNAVTEDNKDELILKMYLME